MSMSCEKCVFCSTYSDMSASCRVCTLHTDLSSAVEAYEHNMNYGDCSCCIFVCDLYDALSCFGSLPDINLLNSWRYKTSKATKEVSPNRDLFLSISRVSCRGE